VRVCVGGYGGGGRDYGGCMVVRRLMVVELVSALD
jgi:hypothetical protein